MRAAYAGLVLAALFLGTPPGHGPGGQPKDEPKKADTDKTKALMRRKLEHSQKVLEALALNDLEAAAKHADELLKVRKDPHFKAFKTPEYELWGDEFSRSAEGVVKGAKDKNLEAAKLHYLGMTLSCFHCHSYTRDQRRID